MLQNMNFIGAFILINVAFIKCATINTINNHPSSESTSTYSTLIENKETTIHAFLSEKTDSEGDIKVEDSSPEPPTNTLSPLLENKQTPLHTYLTERGESKTDLQVRKLAKQTKVIWKRIRELFSANDSPQEFSDIVLQVQNASIENNKEETSDANTRNNGNGVSVEDNLKSTETGGNVVSGRQFVFHPFLPYGKEVMPDEKISFHDVLPVKMVKFIKGMVEDAPWEQMFMKMVRMVVDQFVDKIIEKMFEHDKEHDDKWRRSFDGGEVLTPGNEVVNLASKTTTVVRMKRSSKTKNDKEENGVFQTENRLSKGDKQKETDGEGEESWLDSVLEYLFPEDTKTDLREEDAPKTRRKRELDVPDILDVFFVKLYELETGREAPERLKTKVRAEVRRQLLTSVAKYEGGDIVRRRRSVEDQNKRLWQDNRRTRPLNHPRGECSLRRACNTGRLLARLPSVKDITLQLKSYAKEPHWDALVWGMNKKKCSKIFCKRQRAPKGSKHRWDLEEKRRHNAPSRGPKLDDFENPESLLIRYE